MVVAGAAVSALMLGAGCREQRSDKPPRQFLPDMDDSPKWEPQGQSTFYQDGRMMRPEVPGTVAFGWTTDRLDDEGVQQSRADMLKADVALYKGTYIDEEGKKQYVRTIPEAIVVDEELLNKGQERFNIYCSACHGYLGDGNGMVGQRWSYPVANLHTDIYLDREQEKGTDGYLFNVVRYGVIDQTGAQKMPGYGHALNERDAWAVVAYLRALQSSWVEDIQKLPAEERELRERQMREKQLQLQQQQDEDQAEPVAAAQDDQASGGAQGEVTQ